MKKLFRPRNLIILFIVGVVVGVVLSKKNAAPAPTYPDPWATPKLSDTPKATETPDGEAAPSTNGSSTEAEAADA